MEKKQHPRHIPWNKRLYAGDYIIGLLFILLALLTLYPFWYVLVGSFNQGPDYLSGGVFFWPRTWSFANYLYVLADKRLYHSLLISILRTVIGTFTSVVFTAMVAYAMSIKTLRFRRFFYWFNIVTMFFSGGLIPFFLLMVGLGLYDNFLVYIVPGLYSVFNMLVFTNFFSGISPELRESALIDGANEFQIMFKVVFPVCLPVFATVALWTAVGHWNAYYDTMLYTSDSSLWTFQYYLMVIIKQLSAPPDLLPLPAGVSESVSAQTVTFATIVISMIPVLLCFPLIKKAYKTGSLMGSVKE